MYTIVDMITPAFYTNSCFDVPVHAHGCCMLTGIETARSRASSSDCTTTRAPLSPYLMSASNSANLIPDEYYDRTDSAADRMLFEHATSLVMANDVHQQMTSGGEAMRQSSGGEAMHRSSGGEAMCRRSSGEAMRWSSNAQLVKEVLEWSRDARQSPTPRLSDFAKDTAMTSGGRFGAASGARVAPSISSRRRHTSGARVAPSISSRRRHAIALESSPCRTSKRVSPASSIESLAVDATDVNSTNTQMSARDIYGGRRRRTNVVSDRRKKDDKSRSSLGCLMKGCLGPKTAKSNYSLPPTPPATNSSTCTSTIKDGVRPRTSRVTSQLQHYERRAQSVQPSSRRLSKPNGKCLFISSLQQTARFYDNVFVYKYMYMLYVYT